MMNKSLRILQKSIYFLFTIIFVSSCSNSPTKGTSVSGIVNKTNNYIPKVETSSKDNEKPHVYTVSISEMKFHPEKIEVHKGDTVIWINHDIVAHCVTEITDKVWTSSEIPPEGSWKMAVTQSSDYYCSIHPVMKGKIVMK